MLDLAPVLPVVFAFASAVLAAAVPFVVPLLCRTLRVHINAAQAAVIDAAVKRGAGVALGFLQANEGTIAMVPLHNTALAMGAEYVLRRVPVYLKALGLTPDVVQEMIGAELQRAIPARAVLMPPAAPAVQAPVAVAASDAGGAIAKALGVVVVMGLLGATLSACGTPAQQAAVATVACRVDGAVVPVGQAALTAAGGAAAAASGVDALLVHPAIVAACAQLNGVPVVAPVSAAPAVAAVPAK